ncbi:MAG: tagaturonate epimerase family protein [Rhodothermales bacterium]
MSTPNTFTIEGKGTNRMLRIAGDLPDGFHGERVDGGYRCPLDARNAQALRRALPWTAPELVGKKKSFGYGDRLGIATPGHLRAARTSDMFPVLAQQSIREMERARRSAQQVMDDVTWAVLESDYRDGFGCDADHVKTPEEIDTCIDAGYVGFTLDPGQYVNDDAETASTEELSEELAAFPWDVLHSNPAAHQRYFVSEHGFSVEDYQRSAVKYGRAVARVAVLNTHIADRFGSNDFDLEVSVDETDTATTPQQHRYIALELRRLGIDFIGLAPRFVGHFYKGVDFVGDLDAFDADYAAHAAVAEELGPYKLSVHSGSDKLSIYPLVNRHTPRYVHVKTSGTSWLEALRIIAEHDAKLFGEILEMARSGYATNRRSYHLDGEVDKMPDIGPDAYATLLDDHHARQVLHVAFGPVLEAFYDDIYAILNERIEDYWNGLEAHFGKHLAPFSG